MYTSRTKFTPVRAYIHIPGDQIHHYQPASPGPKRMLDENQLQPPPPPPLLLLLLL
jgi:hypothetical protein